MTVNIITPEGGSKNYVFMIALRNEIIGNVIFKDKKDLEHFKEKFDELQPLGFGCLQLNIDCQDDDNE